MAELTCSQGHLLRPDGRPGGLCDETCDDDPGPPLDEQPRTPDGAPRPASPPPGALTLTVADVRITVGLGETVMIGREGDARMAGSLERHFPGVGRAHVALTAGSGSAEILPSGTRNGTYLGTYQLPADEPRTVPLPVVLRLGLHCFVWVEAIGD